MMVAMIPTMKLASVTILIEADVLIAPLSSGGVSGLDLNDAHLHCGPEPCPTALQSGTASNHCCAALALAEPASTSAESAPGALDLAVPPRDLAGNDQNLAQGRYAAICEAMTGCRCGVGGSSVRATAHVCW